MKNNILLIALLSYGYSMVSQAPFSADEITITTETNGPEQILSVDLDNDGLEDLVSGSWTDKKLAWYKNLGDGIFGSQQVLAILNNWSWLNAGDLDANGYQDIVVGSIFDNELLWFQNMDGTGFTQSLIADAERVQNPVIGDFDNDGDLDVAAATDFDDTIRWYENSDGLGTFTTQHVIATQGNMGRTIATADFDNDNDLDILATSAGSEVLSWYKNDGDGNFTAPIIIDGEGQASVYLSTGDCDNDGDIDIIVGNLGENSIYYYENLDGLGTFSDQVEVDFMLSAVQFPTLVDINDDGYLDIISSEGGERPSIAWYKNNGDATFSNQIIIKEDLEIINYINLQGSDVDNDGNVDIVFTNSREDYIGWLRNDGTLSTQENKKPLINVYPNPTKNTVYIERLSKAITSLQLFTVSGELLSIPKQQDAFDLSQLPSGLYFIRVQTSKQQQVFKVIKN